MLNKAEMIASIKAGLDANHWSMQGLSAEAKEEYMKEIAETIFFYRSENLTSEAH